MLNLRMTPAAPVPMVGPGPRYTVALPFICSLCRLCYCAVTIYSIAGSKKVYQADCGRQEPSSCHYTKFQGMLSY